MDSSTEPAHCLDAIAIVGIAAELPSGEHSTANFSHDELFKILLQKKETYQKVPIDRFDIDRWRGDGPGQIRVDTGSFLKNLAEFDHVEFGVTAKDARAMAVSTRKLLQLAFLALLDSGVNYRGQDIGCFTSAVDFDILALDNSDVFDARGSVAGVPCMVANKISYHLDLLGPSVPLNTACSSSLTALHLAVQSLRNGECKAAVVGGCQLNHRLVDWITYSQASVLARDGKCKPFDAHADGFSRGEGAAVIVIKPLKDAIRDKDHIYASILGTGINSSGLGGPVSAPVASAQKDAMYRAYRGTGRLPSEVDFVEMHATGTAAGDPTEANWVGESFQRDSDILIGSIKGNIGHLEITAFLASLLKVCSMFETRLIPPNINLGELNPKIKWDEYRLRVVTDVGHLSARHPSGRALVSIASSGIGGSNGHVVVEAAPPRESQVPTTPVAFEAPVLLAIGGLSIRSISALRDRISKKVSEIPPKDLAALAAVSGRRARQLGWRSITLLTPDNASPASFSNPVLAPRKCPSLVYVFAGQGPQYLEMGRELYQNYEAFRKSIDAMDEVYKQEVGVSFIESTGLFASSKYASELSSIWPINITLPAMAMVQLALVDLLRSINVFPDVVIGFSAGETAMLYASGAASRELVIALAIARGKAMLAVDELKGGMAALSCSSSKAMAIIMEVTGGDSNGLDIACYNTPDSVTIAGHSDPLDRAVQLASEQGIFARRLRTNAAMHSQLIDVCQTQYRSLVEDVFTRYGPVTSPIKAVYSTLTGRVWRDAFTADYYWNSARRPVLFSDAVTQISKDYPDASFIEISPHSVLSSYLRSLVPKNNIVLCPMERPKTPRKYHESSAFLSTIGQLLLKGYNMIDFASLNGFNVVPRTSFDFLDYPLSKKQVQYLPEPPSIDTGKPPVAIGQPKIYRMNSQTYPDLAQHVIMGEPVVPATGFIDMGLSQGARQLRDVQFHAMLPLSSREPLLVKLESNESHWSIVTFGASGKGAKKVHAEGYFSNQVSDEAPKALHIQDIIERCTPIDTKDFYDQLRYFANYGPVFQRLVACYKGEEEAVAKIRGSGNDLRDSIGNYVIHPAILDACLHLAVHRILTGNTNDQEYYLPSKVESVIVHDALTRKGMPEEIFVYARFKSWKPDALTFDFTVTDDKGTPLCQLSGFTLSKHRSVRKASLNRCYDMKDEKLPVGAIHADADGSAFLDTKNVVIHYVRGGEMQIKATLLPLNKYEKLDIWFLASNDANGAAARGLTRTLRRELPSWNIRLVLFPTETPTEYRLSMLQAIKERVPSEDEIIVDGSGNIYGPRFVESPTGRQLSKDVKSEVKFDAQKAYLLLGGVGSLGVRIALWMYEHGARHIILASRSGPQSKALLDTANRRILTYLQGLPDISIRVERCNITLEEDIKSLLQSIDQPIGGCLLLAVVFSDRTFFAQTAESYSLPFVSKTQAFLALKEALDISKLDFLISFSSIATFGNSGQTNYSSANTALDEMIRPLPNAFSVINPLILDTSVVEKAGGHLNHLLRWGVSSEDLCEYLGDAILKLKYGPFWYYVPDFDWSMVNKYMGRSSLYDHLVPQTSSVKKPTKPAPNHKPDLIRSIVMKYVDIDPEDFYASAPLSSYGLDSLTAAQLSSDLEPFVSVTQLQLLADTSLDDILKRAEEGLGTGSGQVVAQTDQKRPDLIRKIVMKHIDVDPEDFFSSAPLSSYGMDSLTAAQLSSELEPFLTISQLQLLADVTLDDILERTKGQSEQVVTGTGTENGHAVKGTDQNRRELIRGIVMKHIDVDPEDFFPSAPLSSYGMDSLTAAQLSSDLEPFLTISQIQLLADVTLDDILGRAEEQTGQVVDETDKSSTELIRSIVMKHIDVDPEDFFSSAPLSSYGMDSLTAAQLSSDLEPFLTISQLQLLADVTLDDILMRVKKETGEGMPETGNDGDKFSWSKLNKKGQTLVKLREGDGIPLILIHGSSGDIIPFKPLQDLFTTPLWAIQLTPDAPSQSISDLAKFYYKVIKKAKPKGPYRLGGFSGTSLVTYEVAHLIEGNGDELKQLILIDHFPSLLHSPLYRVDEETARTGRPSQGLVSQVMTSIAELYRLERNPTRRKLGEELSQALSTGRVTPYMKGLISATEDLMAMTAKFLLDLAGGEIDAIPKAIRSWVRQIKAPVSIYFATEGNWKTIPEDEREEWRDFRARQYLDDPEIIIIDNSHFGMLESMSLVQALERNVL